jgi:hypothetical protein
MHYFPRVAPIPVLHGHANHQLLDLLLGARAFGATRNRLENFPDEDGSKQANIWKESVG